MIRMLMFRHAESEKNLKPHIIGGSNLDSPLSENGEVQARNLGFHFVLEKYKPTYIFTSPAVRCLRTYDLSFKVARLSMNATIDENLTELDQGVAEGRLRSEMFDEETIKKINADCSNFKFEGGESQADGERRMMKFLNRVENLNINGELLDVLVFSHGLALRCLLRGILNYPAENNFFHMTNLHNAHAMELIFNDLRGKWQFSRYNVKC